MIARIWHGWTRPEDADAYEALLETEVLPGIAAMEIPGYLGAEVLRRVAEEREGGEEIEFVTILRFTSLEVVRAFTGEDYAAAHVPPAARELLERFDARSRHYEVLRGRGEEGGG